MLARPRWALAALLAIVGMSLAFVAIQVEANTRLSPIDELSHLDYMFRSPTVLAPGDKVEQEAMHEQACRGVAAEGFDPIKCDPRTVYDADIYQEKGFNTAATNTPIYYTATRGVAEVIRLLTPTDSLFVSGRLASGFWLALGLVLTYLAGRRAGVRPAPLLAVLALLLGSPAVLYPSTTVTPDAMGLAAGALVVLAALGWERRPTKKMLALLVLVCVVVSLIKITNVVAVAALAFYFLLSRPMTSTEAATPEVTDTRTAGTRDRRIAAVAVGAFSLLAAAAWTLVSNARSHQDPTDVPDMAVRFTVTEFPWTGLLDNALVMVQPLSSPWAEIGTPSLMWFATSTASMVLFAGTAAAALFSSTTPRATLLARCILAAAVLGSLGLVTMGYVTASMYFPLPPRYGIALLAPMALVAASLLRTRSSVAIVAGIAAVTLVTTAFRLAGLP